MKVVGQGQARQPHKAYRAPTFKGNEEGCEKEIFMTGSGEKKQAAEFTKALKGLCQFIERNNKEGQEIIWVIQTVDVNIILPENQDLKARLHLANGKEDVKPSQRAKPSWMQKKTKHTH